MLVREVINGWGSLRQLGRGRLLYKVSFFIKLDLRTKTFQSEIRRE